MITNLISVKIAFYGSPRVIYSFTASNITFTLISFDMPKSTELIAGKAMDGIGAKIVFLLRSKIV